MNVEEARFNMVEQQIRPWNVLNPAVLETFFQVKREGFVPTAYRDLAFADAEIPLAAAHGGEPARLMLAPKIEARLLQDAALRPSDMVLEVGSGSGHMAALMAAQAKNVLSFESSAALAEVARQNIRKAGIKNVQVLRGSPWQDLTKHDHFDFILLSGSLPSVPMDLLKYLNPQGRMLAVIGEAPVMQVTLIQHVQNEQFESAVLWDTSTPRLQGFGQVANKGFQF